MKKCWAVTLSMFVLTLFLTACTSSDTGGGSPAEKELKLAFVTNTSADFWTIARMTQVLNGDKSAIPLSKQIVIPTTVVNKANIEEFSRKVKELRGR